MVLIICTPVFAGTYTFREEYAEYDDVNSKIISFPEYTTEITIQIDGEGDILELNYYLVYLDDNLEKSIVVILTAYAINDEWNWWSVIVYNRFS